MISSVILAAGESKRMGRPKLLMPFGEKTIIENIVSTVLQSEIDTVHVVLGAHHEKILRQIKKFPVKTIYNPDYSRGMLFSIRKGLEALPKDCAAALIVLGDQPSLSIHVINQLIMAFHSSDKGIVLPVYRRKRGHPVLISAEYFPTVFEIDPAVGLRALIRRFPNNIEEVTVSESGILQDIDCIQDYEREIRLIGKSKTKVSP